MGTTNPILVALAMLSLISLGLLLNLFTAFFPLLLWAFQPPAQSWFYVLPIIFVQCTHLMFLWTDKAHLAAYRFLTLPIRRALLPVVMFVAKMDATKDKENVAFLALEDATIGEGKEGFLQHFRSNTRRSYKKTLKAFQSEGIRVDSVQCESSLDLFTVCPVIWEHQKRQCQIDGKNLIAEFIKRFLVVSVVPDCVLDLFYKDETLIAVSVDIRTGPVYYAFLYFARDDARRSGIWFYCNLLALVRAKSLPGVELVNGLTHHMDSKRNAGFQVASYDNDDRMDALFPWASTERIPDEALVISLLDDEDEDDDDGASNGEKTKTRKSK